MNGTLYTYKTHYKIAEFYERIDRVLSISTAGGTGILATLVIWGAVPQWLLIIIALAVAFVSWTNTMLNLGVKSKEHYHAGDQYHALFEEYRDFVDLTLSSTDPDYEEKKRI